MATVSAARKLYTMLIVAVIAYIALGGWFSFEGIRRGGGNPPTAFVVASLGVLWPVAWGYAIWPYVVKSDYSWRGTVLLWLALSQMILSVAWVYILASQFLTYFDAVPILLLAVFCWLIWYTLLTASRIQHLRQEPTDTEPPPP
jgi:hypothetical protein